MASTFDRELLDLLEHAGCHRVRSGKEDCAPPGSVRNADYLTPEFTMEAEALVRGIYAMANRKPR